MLLSRVCRSRFTLNQDIKASLCMESADSTGMRVWTSAATLSSYFINHRRQRSRQPRFITELGAGTGACGLCLHAALNTLPNEDTFVLTDRFVKTTRRINVDGHGEVELVDVLTPNGGSVYSNLLSNVEANGGAKARLFAAPLEMGRAGEVGDFVRQWGTPDVLLASELMYSEGMSDATGSTVLSFFKRGVRELFFSNQDKFRPYAEKFVGIMEDAGLRVEEVKHESWKSGLDDFLREMREETNTSNENHIFVVSSEPLGDFVTS